MTPEEFRKLSPKEQSLHLKVAAIQEIDTWGLDFPGRPSGEYIARIAFQEGKSLGASVAEAIIEEKDSLVAQLAGKVTSFRIFTSSLCNSVLIDLMYASSARDFLIAEEVARSNEPPEPKPVSLNDEVTELADSIWQIVDTVDRLQISKEEGYHIDQAEWEDKQVAEQADSYLRKQKLGTLLLASSDPLEFIDKCINPKPIRDPNDDLDMQLLGAVADQLVLMGRERFYYLYIAATSARNKFAGLSMEERHQESLRLLARKNNPDFRI